MQREEQRDRRWPRWVYGIGTEPDPRFSFANERTFLAWLRTGIALIAGAVALDAFEVDISSTLERLLIVLLLLLGAGCAAASWLRWARAERAIRRGVPLPWSPLGPLLAVGIVFTSAVLIVGPVGWW